MARRPLIDEIGAYRKTKKILIPTLLVLGFLGLFLPVLPGVALIFLALLLIFPQQGDRWLQKIRQFLKRQKHERSE